MRTPYVSYVLLSKIILLSFCSFYLKIVILFLDEPSGIAESYVL